MVAYRTRKFGWLGFVGESQWQSSEKRRLLIDDAWLVNCSPFLW